MARQAGQVLSAEDVREYQAYGNAGLTLPDKFDGVVVDHTNITGPVYRYRTNAEDKAAADAEKATAEAAADAEKLDQRIRAEAAKRGVTVPPPAAPPAPPTPSA